MFKNYQIICVTPAGRRRYMKLLAPFIIDAIEKKIVDEWHIWVNTLDSSDIKFFHELNQNFSGIRIIPQPDGIINGNASINSFFKYCIDENTIYIRFDDDIVWIEPNFFEKFCEFRLNNPEYFLVFPLIINNAICTHLLQQFGHLKVEKYITASSSDNIAWRDPYFAYNLHNWFIKILNANDYEKLHFDWVSISLNRFSINCISWFGNDMKKVNGIIIGDEEEDLTVNKPRELKKINVIYGGCIVSHFAFYTQRNYLDSTDILDEYEQYLVKNRPDLEVNFKKIIEIINTLEGNEYEKEKYKIKYNYFKIKKKLAKIRIPYIKFITLSEVKHRLRLSLK